MKEYQFQYTRNRNTLLVLLPCIIIFVAIVIIGALLSIQILIVIIVSFTLSFIIFRAVKNKAISNCVARLSETSVEFQFDNNTSRTINFTNLTSFKVYYGQNATVLYLRNNADNFKIYANSNFCKPDSFNSFCEDIVTQLDKYKIETKSNLIHQGSIFATKGMLYFLISATLIYLISFFIESKKLRIAIGITGGFYLFIMWTRYFIEKKRKFESQ